MRVIVSRMASDSASTSPGPMTIASDHSPSSTARSTALSSNRRPSNRSTRRFGEWFATIGWISSETSASASSVPVRSAAIALIAGWLGYSTLPPITPTRPLSPVDTPEISESVWSSPSIRSGFETETVECWRCTVSARVGTRIGVCRSLVGSAVRSAPEARRRIGSDGGRTGDDRRRSVQSSPLTTEPPAGSGSSTIQPPVVARSATVGWKTQAQSTRIGTIVAPTTA